ncbi:MAG: hypothetical protein ACOCW0_00010 [Halanaerobium sp.]
MKSLEEKIKEITEADFDVHYIFKEIVTKQSAFTENEEIVDLVFIKRRHSDERNKDSKIIEPAKIVVATTHGIVFAEEGFKEISENYYGYRMKHTYYDKISNLELDMCLLKGLFKVTANSSKNAEIEIKFNTANYFREFEHFLNVVRKHRINY